MTERQPSLVVLAAGMGSRYGGLKQIDPIGAGGEVILDYSLYDALRAGFGQVVFVIRHDLEDVFREKIGRKVEQRIPVDYVFQEISNLPAGFALPPERKKPWGTGHAVLCCKDVIRQPFAVINADDFYGAGAFRALASYLRQAEDRNGMYDFCMVGFQLGNTLSAHGSVARGICQVSHDGDLQSIQERTRIEKDGDAAHSTENGVDWLPLAMDCTVSMNMFGFTPGFFAELERAFQAFLEKNAADLSRVEFFLPDPVNALLLAGKARVKVLPTADRWFGVTHPQDRAAVQAEMGQLVEDGVYPGHLWG